MRGAVCESCRMRPAVWGSVCEWCGQQQRHLFPSPGYDGAAATAQEDSPRRRSGRRPSSAPRNRAMAAEAPLTLRQSSLADCAEPLPAAARDVENAKRQLLAVLHLPERRQRVGGGYMEVGYRVDEVLREAKSEILTLRRSKSSALETEYWRATVLDLTADNDRLYAENEGLRRELSDFRRSSVQHVGLRALLAHTLGHRRDELRQMNVKVRKATQELLRGERRAESVKQDALAILEKLEGVEEELLKRLYDLDPAERWRRRAAVQTVKALREDFAGAQGATDYLSGAGGLTTFVPSKSTTAKATSKATGKVASKPASKAAASPPATSSSCAASISASISQPKPSAPSPRPPAAVVT